VPNSPIEIVIKNAVQKEIVNDKFIPDTSGEFSRKYFASGPGWYEAGVYEVIIKYNGKTSNSNFFFIGKTTDKIQGFSVNIEIDDQIFELLIRGTGAIVNDLTLDYEFASLILDVDSEGEVRVLELFIPREFFDSKFQGKDDIFIIVADASLEGVEYYELFTTEDYRLITIELPFGTEKVEIIGTHFYGDPNASFSILYDQEVKTEPEPVPEPEPEPVKTADDVYKMICSSPDGYCMSQVGMNNPDAYGACLGRWVTFCQTYEAKQTPDTNSEILCGEGTIENEFGQCVLISQTKGGGCLIATATFGSELAPQVQMLREIRDNSLLQTQSGQSFMQGFNQFYYSFSPTIADYERQNPVFKEAVKVTITPLLASLSILNYVDLDSEESVLGYGIGIILLNVGMYFVAPAILIAKMIRIKI